MEGDVWTSFAHDPRDPTAAPLRASDADREVIHQVLAGAFADGRLDRGEYDERSGAALSARTLGEWPAIVMAATFVNVLRVAGSRRQIVAEEVRRLQRKQAKELEKKQRDR